MRASIKDKGWYGGFGLQYENFSTSLRDHNINYGRLHVSCYPFSLRFAYLPQEDNFIGYHVSCSVGFADTSFSKDRMLELDDFLNGRYTKIRGSSMSGTGSLGGGVDLYINSNSCFSLSYRFKFVDAYMDWDVVGGTLPKHAFFEEVRLRQHQLVFSLCFFF